MIEDTKQTGVPNGASFSRGRMQLVKPQQAMNSGRTAPSAASAPAASSGSATATVSPYKDEVGPLEQYLTKLNDQSKLVKAIQSLGVDGFRDVIDQLGGPYKEMLGGPASQEGSNVYRRGEGLNSEYRVDPNELSMPSWNQRRGALTAGYQGDDPELQMRASMMGKAMGRNQEAFTPDEQNYMAKLQAKQIVDKISSGLSGANR